MQNTIWEFKTRNFHVICKGYVPAFIDPYVHSEQAIDMVDAGMVYVLNLCAKVFFHELEIGVARLPNCVYQICQSDIYDLAPDDTNIMDHRHTNLANSIHARKVVRWAIASARESLPDISNGWPDLYIRN